MSLVTIFSLAAIVGCNTTSPKSHHGGIVERDFNIRYVTSMKDCPVGENFRLWIPIPHDDGRQRISDMEISGPVAGTLYHESKFRNQMYYVEGICSADQMDFTIEYHVTRRECSIDLEEYQNQEEDGDRGDEFDIFLQPSTLCFVTPQVKKEASELIDGKNTTIEKARAFFYHILGEMAYDKAHDGWGRGDIIHACNVGKGNCTDFHTYFNALCMASGIPSRFQIGMWGKYEQVSGEYRTGGYHCWSEFHVAGQGWVPVDISEADKVESNRDGFFGSQTANRVTISTGRDIILTPAQNGPPLNYFVNPYAEIDGKPFTSVSKSCYWTDIPLN